MQFQEDTKWAELFDEAHKALVQFFKSPSPSDGVRQRTKVASSILSNYTRHEATESARQQTSVIVAREISKTPEEFKKYMEASMPTLQLAEGKKTK